MEVLLMPKGISIMSQLLSVVNYGDGKEVNADIAKTILQNYNKIPELTIFDLADLCYVLRLFFVYYKICENTWL